MQGKQLLCRLQAISGPLSKNSSLVSFLPEETKSTWCPFNLETKENKGKQIEAKLSSLEI